MMFSTVARRLPIPSLRGIDPRVRYLVFLAACAGLTTPAGIARLVLENESAFIQATRWSMTVTFIVGALLLRKGSLLVWHRDPVMFTAIMVTLVHMINYLYHSGLDINGLLGGEVVLILAAVAMAHRNWLAATMVAYVIGYSVVAWVIPEPVVSPITFTLVTLPLGLILYQVSSGLIHASESLALKDVLLSQSQSLASVGGWELDLKPRFITMSATGREILGIQDESTYTGVHDYFTQEADYIQCAEAVRVAEATGGNLFGRAAGVTCYLYLANVWGSFRISRTR